MKRASEEICWSKCDEILELQSKQVAAGACLLQRPNFHFRNVCQELLNWITCEKNASDRAFSNGLVNLTATLEPGM